MSHPSSRHRNPKAVGAFVGLGLVLGLIATGSGQAPRRAERVTAHGQRPTPTFFSANDCARCHRPNDAAPPLIALESGLKPNVRLDEFKTWSESNKHRRAFDALLGDRGQSIGKRMGMKEAAGERACLSCHGTGFLPNDPPAESSGAWTSREQGVGCIACHGSYREWVLNHGSGEQVIREWRQKSAQVKADQFGMTNLRDPAERARVCVSCHIGNADEGKVVSHAMYAAGHPPLPGFELSTFSQAMPPHWDPEPGRLARTRMTLVGALVSLRESMKLLAAEARPGALPSAVGATTWPEYSQFDCYACHHELRAPGYREWRQLRAAEARSDGLWARSVPGRPQFRPWPLALARLARTATTSGAAPAQAQEDLLRKVQTLRAAFTAQPFGSRADVARAAIELATWADSELLAVSSSQLDAASPAGLLLALTAVSDHDSRDYDSARQIAWAIKTIFEEWQPRPSNRDDIVARIGELDRLLKLDPDQSRLERTRLSTSKDLTESQRRERLLRASEAEYQQSLTRAAEYDPAAFKRTLERLGALLRARSPQTR